MVRSTRDKRSLRSLLAEECEARLCLSSVSFVPHDVFAVEETGEKLARVLAADMDGDGDIDVVSTSSAGTGDKLAWYENDGVGSFGEQRVIATHVSGEFSLFVADGDIDVLAATSYQQGIAWYENADGAGNFVEQVISTQEQFRRVSLSAADMDGDGDIDVLSIGANNKIAWYENDGAGNFEEAGGQQFFRRPSSFVGADVNGDGNGDLIVGVGRQFVWYEGDGTGRFDIVHVISEDYWADFLTAADVDGDGDMDLLTMCRRCSGLVWRENTDGAGSFGRPQTLSTRQGPHSVVAADLDGDGDVDALSAWKYGGGDPAAWSIAWNESTDGAGSFRRPQMIRSGDGAGNYMSVFAADMDGDGDMDVLLALDKITWYEKRLNGDSNDDNVFNSSDLVEVFGAGKYEDGIDNNATFDEGDWNLDGDFDSSDLVAVFEAGHYVRSARPLDAEIAAAVELAFGDDEDERTAFVP